MVIPVYPGADPTSGLVDGGKVVLPSAFFFERPKESLDNTILLRSVGRDELLRKPIEPSRLAKPSALKDETVVASDGRSLSHWSDCPKTIDTGRFKGSFSFIGSASCRQFVSDDFPIETINDGHEMTKTISSTGKMRDIHCPSSIRVFCDTRSPLNPGPRSNPSLVTEPSNLPNNPVNPFPIHFISLFESEYGPDSPISKRWMLLDV